MPNQEIFARFALGIERFFANKIPEPTVVEDLMHDTFLRFFERRARRDEEERDLAVLGPFLMGIAKNVLFEYWRKKSKSDRTDEIGDLSVADLSTGLPSRVSQAERVALIRELLRELPLHQQMVLELHYWERVPYKGIAKILEVPFGTVATWGRAGRATVRQKLEQELGKSLPESEGTNDSTGSHPWYEPTTGNIDRLRLANTAMLGKRKSPSRAVPSWLSALQLPDTLPGASARELSEIGKTAWEAWVEAGRP